MMAEIISSSPLISFLSPILLLKDTEIDLMLSTSIWLVLDCLALLGGLQLQLQQLSYRTMRSHPKFTGFRLFNLHLH